MNLFIPYVFTTIGEQKIKEVIEKQECLGTVEKIDIVERVDDKTGKPFNMAYVHMAEWNHTHHAIETMNEIRNNGKKVVYYTQNKKGPYWSLAENTYKAKAKPKTAMLTTPPKLVRNDPFTTPELNCSDSIGECPGAPLREEDLYAYASQTSCAPVNLADQFAAVANDVEYETDGLVHESYVTQLENEVAMLRNLIVQMQMQAYGMGV